MSHAVSEEKAQFSTTGVADAKSSESSPSSASKDVLVVGGTGGVGKLPHYGHFLLHFASYGIFEL